MKKEILSKIMELTEEEQEILAGRKSVDQSLYTDDKNFIIDKNKLLLPEQLISVRKHTRFIDFPMHKHNYVELSYVYMGQMTQIVDGSEITLQEGELMILNQVIAHEIMAVGPEDIIINFIIKPEFFQYIFSLADTDNSIFNFILNTIYTDQSKGEYLYYKVSDETSIKETIEKIITELYEPSSISNVTIKLLVGLLLVELTKHSKNIEVYSADNYEKKLNLDILRYIDEHYVEGSLTQIAKQLNQPDYKICRIVKKYTGVTFKQLVQETRLNKTVDLLTKSDLSIADIMESVGYENITYFYKIFKEKYTMTPNEYRKAVHSKI